MNFNFICTLIFMIGPLDLIRAEPYPKLSFGKPFLDKRRELEETNYIVVKYGKVAHRNGDYSGARVLMNGMDISRGITDIPAGTEIEIHFSEPVDNLNSFFYNDDCNVAKIISIDFSNLYAPNLGNVNYLFNGCTSLKIANLSNLKYNLNQMNYVFDEAKKLKILILSNANIPAVNSFYSFLSKNAIKIRYLDIMGASLSTKFLSKIGGFVDESLNIICTDKEGFQTKGNRIDACCDFKAETDKCQSQNYLKIYYENSKTFSSGFYDDRTERKGDYINFVINDDSILLDNESLTVKNGSIVEIYFKQSLTNLSYYFSKDIMASVDFSHFETSNIKEFQGIFKDCESLKTIDLSYAELSLVNNFESLCSNCINLESANLSYITTQPIGNMKTIFSQCSKLKAIDISGLDMESAQSDSAFEGLTNLKYINIKDSKLSPKIIQDIKNLENSLTICQNSPILAKKGYKYSCCSYEGGKEICKPSNSIIVYFANEENNQFQFKQNYVGNIYVISGDTPFTTEMLESNPTIEVGSQMYIFFKSPITTLESFFEGASNIVSVDLSNFNLSLVESFKNMFKGSSLSYIDLSNLNAPSLTNMASMFEDCSELLNVNLSNLTTSKVTNMENMLKGCTNLRGIDLYGIDFTSEESNSDLFESFLNLKYLNIKDVEFKDNIKEQIKKIIFAKNETIVCQNDDLDIERNIFNLPCCNYFLRIEKCESFNFIKAKYNIESNIETNYNNGFGDKREGVDYIKLGNEIFKPSDKFIINADTNNGEVEIYFPEEVTSLKDMFNVDIDTNVENIISIDFSNFNTSFLTDMNSLFKGCTGLQTINFSNFDTSGVTDMNHLFHSCTALESIDLSIFNTESVTNMNSMFNSCEKLKSIDIFHFRTSNVTDMGSMFAGCKQLLYAKLKNFDTSSVTDMSNMFSGCENLKLIDISRFNMQNVTNALNMFSDLNSLKYVNLYNVENSNGFITESDLNGISPLLVCQSDKLITNEQEVTYTCCNFDFITETCEEDTSNLFRVIFASNAEYPDGFIKDYRNDINFIIGEDYNNKILPNQRIEFVEGITYEIYLKSPIEKFEHFFNSKSKKDSNTKKIKSIGVILPDLSPIESLESMFQGCTSLESITLSHINTSSILSFKSMFRDCSSLKKLDLSHFDTSSAEEMDRMFQGCSSLESVDLCGFVTTSVTSMNYMFAGCISLEYLDLSYFDTSFVETMDNIFQNCFNLKVLDISSFNMAEISKADNMFMRITNLKYINIYNVQNTGDYLKESELKNLDNLTICQKEDIIISEGNAYYNCCYFDIETDKCISYDYMIINYDQDVTYENGFSQNSIESDNDKFRQDDYFIIHKDYINKRNKDSKLVVNKGLRLEIYFTSVPKSLENYFNVKNDPNTEHITNVDISHFDFSSVEIVSQMFSGCGQLQSINFPENIKTSSLKAMSSMFYNCKSLENIDLSNFDTSNVDKMNSLFEGCNKVKLLELYNFNTSLVTDMSRMFYGCEGLEYLDISTFNLEKLEKAENIFDNTNNLEYLNLYHIKEHYDSLTEGQNENWKSGLIVCQKEKIITKENIDNKCCYYNLEQDYCESENYIIIYFGKETIYENGFTLPDSEIDFIINGNHYNKIGTKDKFTIKEGKKIGIYFNSDNSISELANYFSAERDVNMKNVVSIDLSHFYTDFVTDMSSLFYGCESLKSIDFPYLNTFGVLYMNNMFYNCSSLEILDLSSFNTPNLIQMNSMFYGCESLIYLDISNFNLGKIDSLDSFDSVFYKVNNLKYVNLFNIIVAGDYITNSDLNKISGVTVCQKEDLVTNENAIYDCCYYNTKSQKCENNNFAVVYFDSDTIYEDGFQIKLSDGSEFRQDIDFIINGAGSKILPTDKLNIGGNSKITIYFSSSITSLDNFFSAIKDNNMNNVVSIDLSFLKSSTITNMNSMFYGCNSLRKVDFSNIDTSNVKDMNSMFYGCNSLEFIDLSYFDTSNVEDMSFMFYNCTKLKIMDLSYFDTSSVIYMNSMFEGCIDLKLLDISRFNLEKITKADSMFKDLNKLKYINLNYVKDPNGYIAKSEINRNDTTVCQKEKIVTKSTDNRCCYYNLENQNCTNENYITMFFGDKAPYNNGFEKDKYNNVFRFDIDFIINGENHENPLSGSDGIYLHRGSKLELYFLPDDLSLSNYFSAEKDINMKNIVSIYFSNLKIEWFLGINSLFYGCESLKTIVDFIAIDTISMDMSYMFYNCRSLEFIDLSSINLLYIDNCKSMFEGCESLRYLDISHFSFDYDDLNTDSMFKNVSKLEYINVYNVDDYYKKFSIIDSHNFIVCQKEDYKVILNNDTKTKCCYYDLKDKTCEDSNFIEIYYGEDVEYTNFENECRLHENIKYIINYDHNTKLSPKNYFKIKKGYKLEIYYSSPLESLEDYFSPSCDPNMKYIVSVDLSNFDTSSLTVMKSAFEDCEQLQSVGLYNFKGSSIISMNYVFSNCISLYIIDLSYLKLSSVIYMNNMFSGCTSLEVLDFSLSEIGSSLVNLGKMFYGCSSLVYLDLSNLITTSTTHMEQMFSGCTSLTYLDISNFNMEQIMNANSMFENVKSLKYINLYKTKDYNDYISKSELNNLVELTVCQTEQILKKEDVINKCCKYDFFEEECQDTNYIEIYYGEDVIYMEEEFGNDQRKNIDYIYKDHEYFHESEKLNIEKNTKVEIHFKEALESLAGFFCFDDENAKKIVSIDLSYLNTSNLKDISSMFSGCRSLQSVNFLYFNTSLVTNMNSLFEGCAQLESVDLSEFKTSLVSNMSKIFSGCSKLTSVNLYNFDTSSVIDMNNMFYGCSSIQSLDLSNFDTKKVTNFDSIFSGCTNLKVLDISNFNIKTDDNVNNMFDDITKLRYINLYHVEENDKFPDSDLLIFQDINVCQNVNKRIVKSDSIIERCCYFNIETDTCDNSNYIIVTFGEEEIIYEKGIEYGAVDGFYENIRQGKIDFIIDKTDNNKKYNTSVKLNLKENTKIEIYLTNITSLQDFFNSDYDENMKQIISIDLSHLDGSSITDMSLMFKGCESLLSVNFSNFNTSSLTKLNSMFEGCEYIESIDLSYLNTSLVTDMNSLFYGCSQLKYVYLSNINTSKVEDMKLMFWGCKSLISIDLSYFNTSSLTEIDSMFSGCSSLKVLDISNFNLNNITSNKNLFKSVGALRYINLYHVEDNKTIIQSEITTIENLIVCEKEEMNTIVTENKRCCYFNISKDKCEPDNYIIIYYGKESEYKNGFINKYRNDVSFIINGDYLNILETNKEFKVNMGCKIELYFNSLMTSLESFFDYNYDKNIGNIKSIDFSHFKSSLITDMSKTFSGCNSLESIDFYNFNS